MEASVYKVQEQAERVFSSLEKECVRKVQRNMHLCSAKCLENDNSTTQENMNCLSQCQQPIEKLTNYITSEAQNLQSRLERCAMDCQDAAKDMKGGIDEQTKKMKFASCVDNCAEKCINGLPDWHQRVKSNINNNSY